MPLWSKNGKNDRDDDTSSLDNSLNSMQQDENSFFGEENGGIPIPQLASPFYGLINQIAFFGFSQRGESHIKSETSCQDRCYSVSIPDKGVIIAAVADGVGSCALSDLGADVAVHTSVESISNELLSCTDDRLDSIIAGSLLRNAFQSAYDQVEQTAKKYEQLLYSLQSTLTVAIYDGSDLYFGHAGDDGIVALTESGTLALATTRHKGEEASSVFPLQSRNTWQFGMVPNTVAFAMATDGVLDAFVRSSFENDRVYYPFLEPVFTADYSSPERVKQVCTELDSFMKSREYRSAVTDDLSIVVAMNLDKLQQCLPQFDRDAWDEETKQYENKVRTALYGQTKELPYEPREKEQPPPLKERLVPSKDVEKDVQAEILTQPFRETESAKTASDSPLRRERPCDDKQPINKSNTREKTNYSFGGYPKKNGPYDYPVEQNEDYKSAPLSEESGPTENVKPKDCKKQRRKKTTGRLTKWWKNLSIEYKLELIVLIVLIILLGIVLVITINFFRSPWKIS